MKFFDFGYSCYFDSLFVCGSFCQQLIHKLTGVAIALKTTSVWQNYPGFDHNREGWTVFGKGAIKERISNASSRFIVAHNRTHPLDSFSQKVQLKNGTLYTCSRNFTFSTVELNQYHISFTSIHLRNVATLAVTFQKHFE